MVQFIGRGGRMRQLLVAAMCMATSVCCAPLGCMSGWCSGDESPPLSTINILLGIAGQYHQLEPLLQSVSDPLSPSYGQYLSLEAVTAITHPTTKSLHHVLSVLKRAGVTGQVRGGGTFVTATMEVDTAKRLFQVDGFRSYTEEVTQGGAVKGGRGEGREVHRTTNQWKVPEGLVGDVDLISGVHDLPASVSNLVRPSLAPVVLEDRHYRRDREAAASQYGNDVTADPVTVMEKYKITPSRTIAPSSSLGVVEALGQEYSEEDLAVYLAQYNISSRNVSRVVGVNDPSSCKKNADNCVEANLDVQLLVGLGQNIPLTYFSMPYSADTPFYDWIMEVANMTDPPLVHSVSYGEIENCPDSIANYKRVNSEFMKLGIRGVTVLVASGDDGVANFPARTNKIQCGFNPSFPASSPYVLAVGSTQFKGGKVTGDEVAQSSDNTPSGAITTGGGFSSLFARLDHQDKAVSRYLLDPKSDVPHVPHNSTSAPSKGFNIQGRGYPDVSALGHNYPVIINGKSYNVDGTSAAAPVVAAMMALVNNERLLRGKTRAPLGFINPLLYSLAATNPGIFNDVREGRNNCAAGSPTTKVCCESGFTANEGWDPLTGLGSLNFDKLLEACLLL